MRRWWHAEHDWETTVAEVDLRVGGTVRVVMRNPYEDVEYAVRSHEEGWSNAFDNLERTLSRPRSS